MKTCARRFTAKRGRGRKSSPVRQGPGGGQRRRFGMRKGQKQHRTGIPQVPNRSGVRFLATIRADEVYSLEQFVLMTGLGPSAIRQAERDGLRTAFIGNRKQISGSAWLDYVRMKELEQSCKRVGNREPFLDEESVAPPSAPPPSAADGNDGVNDDSNSGGNDEAQVSTPD
jgi:hypothetical protein